MSRWVWVALGLALFGAGCSEKRAQVYPVKGQLFWQGKPAAGAVVFFHPETKAVDSQNPAKGPYPMATVDEDGTFELSTYGSKDGAPLGRYRMSVIWAKSTGQGDEATQLLPAKFMNPATADLPVVEVGDQPTVLAPINLSI